MPKLTVRFHNMCLFVLGDMRAEAWFIQDTRHDPYIDLDKSRIALAPEEIKNHPNGLPLTGMIVSFGEPEKNDGTAPGKEFAGPTILGGRFIDHLVDLDQIAPGATLERSWLLGDDNLPQHMTCRVRIDDGILIPEPLNTEGGFKLWRIGEKVTQRISEDARWERSLSGQPFLRLEDPATAKTVDLELTPDSQGDYIVYIQSRENDPKARLETRHGVVFLTEFQGFDKAVKVIAADFPTPHTYWPEYENQTDPAGGPCGAGLLDLRSKGRQFVS